MQQHQPVLRGYQRPQSRFLVIGQALLTSNIFNHLQRSWHMYCSAWRAPPLLRTLIVRCKAHSNLCYVCVCLGISIPLIRSIGYVILGLALYLSVGTLSFIITFMLMVIAIISQFTSVYVAIASGRALFILIQSSFYLFILLSLLFPFAFSSFSSYIYLQLFNHYFTNLSIFPPGGFPQCAISVKVGCSPRSN